MSGRNLESITRRQFTVAAGSFVALTVFGCERSDLSHDPESAGESAGADEDEGGSKRLETPETPFLVGPADRYAGPGMYDDFVLSKRVWLLSDGMILTALVDVCTHRKCGLDWIEEEDIFECPCHDSTFDRHGSHLPGGKAKRPLDRWGIRIVGTPEGRQVEVDPTQHFRHADDGWLDPQAFARLG